MANTVKARIQLKYDTEENWSKAIRFCPLKGEVIIYAIDDTHPFPRLKIGDGTTLVVDLPFLSDANENKNVQYHTAEYWNSQLNYIPDQGQIIVYSDSNLIKIGDGTTYLVDLPYITDFISQQLQQHTTNTNIHISTAERILWNNKLNLEDTVENQTLQLNRR